MNDSDAKPRGGVSQCQVTMSVDYRPFVFVEKDCSRLLSDHEYPIQYPCINATATKANPAAAYNISGFISELYCFSRIKSAGWGCSHV